VLKQRVITALVLVALLFGALAWSPLAFAVLMAVAFVLAQAEWLQLAGWRFSRALSLAFALGAVLVAGLVMRPESIRAVTFALAALATGVWAGLGVVLLRSEQRGPVRIPSEISTLFALLLPVAAWCSLILFLREGIVMLVSVLVIVWLADTAAYFAGRAFGKTKLAPHISPGKTWAGVWGAMLAVGIVALVAWQAFPTAPLYTSALLDRLGIALALPLFAVLVALSIVGDLFESLLKRQAGVKDSGHLLPGHGGFYDRLDAMLALLPAAALFWIWAT
jgi:phosphatidate cytidylyltransferase